MPLPPLDIWTSKVNRARSDATVSLEGISLNAHFLARARTAIYDWNNLPMESWLANEGALGLYPDSDEDDEEEKTLRTVAHDVQKKVTTEILFSTGFLYEKNNPEEGATARIRDYGKDATFRHSTVALTNIHDEKSLMIALEILQRFQRAASTYLHNKTNKVNRIRLGHQFDEQDHIERQTPEGVFLGRIKFIESVLSNIAQAIDIYIMGTGNFKEDNRNAGKITPEAITAPILARYLRIRGMTAQTLTDGSEAKGPCETILAH